MNEYLDDVYSDAIETIDDVSSKIDAVIDDLVNKKRNLNKAITSFKRVQHNKTFKSIDSMEYYKKDMRIRVKAIYNALEDFWSTFTSYAYTEDFEVKYNPLYELKDDILNAQNRCNGLSRQYCMSLDYVNSLNEEDRKKFFDGNV